MPRVPLYGGPRETARPLPRGLEQSARATVGSHAGFDFSGLSAGIANVGSAVGESEAQLQGASEEAEFLAAQNRADTLQEAMLNSGDRDPGGEDQLFAFQEGLLAIGADLSSPRLQRLWTENSSLRRGLFTRDASRRAEQTAATQLRQAEAERLAAHRTAALDALDDPQAFAERRDLLAVEAELQAATLPPDQRRAQVEQSLAGLHDAALLRNLERGALTQAQEHLDQLPAGLRQERAEALRQEQLLQDGRALAQELLGQNEEAVAAALEQAPLEVADIARRQIAALSRQNSGDPQSRALREQALDAAWEQLGQGTNPDDLPLETRQDLGAEDLGILRLAFDGLGAEEPDPALYERLTALPPQRLAAVDLFGQRLDLGEAAFRSLRSQQLNARRLLAGSDEEARQELFDNHLRRQQLLQRTNAAMDIDRGRLALALDHALRQARRAKGSALSAAEDEAALGEALRSLGITNTEEE
ncbi:MAG: hypothetical protein AAFY02_13885 [Pseudomonadota bacterium]